MNEVIGFLIGMALGASIGWVTAHSTVAHECKMLGRFYVGNTVYECTVIRDESK